jgi:hypothetical protein
MTPEDIIEFAGRLPGVDVLVAGEANGAPQIAWGDAFFFYDPRRDLPADRRFPFATIVTKDYHGFDEASDLDRQGVFRLNVSVGRQRFEELIGYRPSRHAEHAAELDYGVLDTVLPHPVYAKQAWVSILNPGEQTSRLARDLLTHAHARTAARYRSPASRSPGQP